MDIRLILPSVVDEGVKDGENSNDEEISEGSKLLVSSEGVRGVEVSLMLEMLQG